MINFRGPATRGPYRVLGEVLDEAEPRAALARLRLDLELVCDRPDDGDPEASLRELLTLERRRLVGIEPCAVIDDFDAEPVGEELVRHLDVAVASRAVGVPHRVRDRLGQCELQVGHRVVRDLAELREPSQGEPAEREEFGLRRDAQADRAATAARCAVPRLSPIACRMHACPLLFPQIPEPNPADFYTIPAGPSENLLPG